jgi:preprotein translocase subunit SecA
MRRGAKAQTYEEFLASHGHLQSAADRVLAKIAEFSTVKSKEAFRAERLKAETAGARDRPSKLHAALGLHAQRWVDDGTIASLALVCRAAEVALGHPPWHHQIIGALLLSRGVILEMPNGSGKTLCAALAAALNCLAGKRTHIVTHNDYLAERDTRWMGPLYDLFGLSVGVLFSDQSVYFQHGVLQPEGTILRAVPKPGAPLPAGALVQAAAAVGSGEGGEGATEALAAAAGPGDARALPAPGGESAAPEASAAAGELAHETLSDFVADPQLTLKEVLACDVVYGRIWRFGFAYLNDHMVYAAPERVLTERDLLIVDECDAILLDDLDTPLVINSSEPDRLLSPAHLLAFHQLARQLAPNRDFRVIGDSLEITYAGRDRLRELAGVDLFTVQQVGLAHGVVNALQALYIYRRDEDYLVEDGQLRLIEAASGRLLAERRYRDGLHEAIEVKEGLQVSGAGTGRPLARFTIKHFVRTYETVSGMSGVIGRPEEYQEFYGLGAVSLPPYPPSRVDLPDLVYRTRREARLGVLGEAVAAQQRGQPVLINVPTLREVDELARVFASRRVSFQVLDARTARNLQEEAEKVRNAGAPAAITICSKVAARGTDIVLGPAALAAGGLLVIGLERGMDRRYDEQLRGRAGRKGDPGAARFCLSLEDELMRLFGSARISSLMRHLGMTEGEPVEHALVTRSIDRAQRQVQQVARQRRRMIVELDDIMARHRLIFYDLRDKVLTKDDLRPEVLSIAENFSMQKSETVLKAASWRALSPADRGEALRRLNLEPYLTQLEIERVFEVRNERRRAALFAETLRRKVGGLLEDGHGLSPSYSRAAILRALDEHWRRYLGFEDSAREELALYPKINEGIARYTLQMEERFDNLLFEIGADVLLDLVSARLPNLAGAAAAGGLGDEAR